MFSQTGMQVIFVIRTIRWVNLGLCQSIFIQRDGEILRKISSKEIQSSKLNFEESSGPHFVPILKLA